MQSALEMPRNDIGRQTNRGQFVDRAWLVALCIICPAVLLGAVWVVTGFGVNNAARVVAWLGAAVGIAVVLVAAYVANRWSKGLRLACVTCSVCALAGVVVATQYGAVARAKLQLDVASWQKAMTSVRIDGTIGGCQTIRPHSLTLKGLGQVNRICGTNVTTLYGQSIDFLGPHPGTYLAYYPHPGPLPPSDNCAAHIAGPWWQSVAIGAGECSDGFHFTGGI